MTEAANKLIAADMEAKALMDKHPNPMLMPLEELQETVTTFKTKAFAISLDGCTAEFKEAFVAWKLALLEEGEFIVEMLENLKNTGASTPPMEAMAEGQQRSQQVNYTGTRFRAICQQFGLGIQFPTEK